MAAYVPGRNFFDRLKEAVLPFLRRFHFQEKREKERQAKIQVLVLREDILGNDEDDILVSETRQRDIEKTNHHGDRWRQVGNDHGCFIHIQQNRLHVEDEDIQGRGPNDKRRDAVRRRLAG